MQTPEKTTPLKPTRASFIRGLPMSMPTEEVIERGREAGLELQPSDIHAARYYMRQAAAAEATKRPALLHQPGLSVFAPLADKSPSESPSPRIAAPVEATKAKARDPKPAKLSGSPEEQLRTLALRLGTDRVRAVIQQLEDMVQRMPLGR